MASLFEAYITNLGKYNEGELVGETLKFPTTTEEVQGLLKRIGVDGVRYEEFFITSFDGDVLGLYDYLTEYENLDELNHLACLLSELDQSELEKFEAVIDSGEHTSSVADLINLAQNLDCYEFYPGVEDDETLGRIYVEDMEAIDVPEHLLNYFDYEARPLCPWRLCAEQWRAIYRALSRDRGHSRRAQSLCLSAAHGAGADGGLQRNY